MAETGISIVFDVIYLYANIFTYLECLPYYVACGKKLTTLATTFSRGHIYITNTLKGNDDQAADVGE